MRRALFSSFFCEKLEQETMKWPHRRQGEKSRLWQGWSLETARPGFLWRQGKFSVSVYLLLCSSHFGLVTSDYAHCHLKRNFHLSFVSDESAPQIHLLLASAIGWSVLSSPISSRTSLPTYLLSFLPSSLKLGIHFSSSFSLHSSVSFHASLHALCIYSTLSLHLHLIYTRASTLR